jgi:putative flippase GtrA
MTRYAIIGLYLMAAYAAVYWTLAALAGVNPLVANTLAFVLTVASGYALHSRWTFKGHGSREGFASTKYLAVSFAGYALNSFWVWLIVDRWGASVTASLLPIALVTPLLSFWANRIWTFHGPEAGELTPDQRYVKY